LQEIIDVQQQLSFDSNKLDVGKTFEVLVEAVSKRSFDFYSGRTPQNKVVIFPKGNAQKGDYVMVKITECSPATLKGELVI
jgi:tRNA-2-methylthio-N6-dimethylallyladenosine synthase